MIKRIEEKLEESPLLCDISKGVAYALGFAMCVMAVVTGVLAIVDSAVWCVGFLLCVLTCGASFGIGIYLDR